MVRCSACDASVEEGLRCPNCGQASPLCDPDAATAQLKSGRLMGFLLVMLPVIACAIYGFRDADLQRDLVEVIATTAFLGSLWGGFCCGVVRLASAWTPRRVTRALARGAREASLMLLVIWLGAFFPCLSRF